MNAFERWRAYLSPPICTEVHDVRAHPDGSFCKCNLPAVHVFFADAAARWHRCGDPKCARQWVDIQQKDEIHRLARQGKDWPDPARSIRWGVAA